MTCPPLCIIQARYGSTRLPGKMLCKIGGETLIERAWRIACDAFGKDHCVIAIPCGQPVEFREHLHAIGATVFESPANESDVLLRFVHCAHAYRWRPDAVIVRYTPDDWSKSVDALRRVASGERMAVEIGGEAFTMAMLDEADHRIPEHDSRREHITYALFAVHPVKPPAGRVWSIDTQADLDAVNAEMAPVPSPKPKKQKATI